MHTQRVHQALKGTVRRRSETATTDRAGQAGWTTLGTTQRMLYSCPIMAGAPRPGRREKDDEDPNPKQLHLLPVSPTSLELLK